MARDVQCERRVVKRGEVERQEKRKQVDKRKVERYCRHREWGRIARRQSEG